MSSECKLSGQAISALAGRYARACFTLSDGWVRDDVDGITIEDFRDHVDKLFDAPMSEPGSLGGELEAVIARIRAAKDSARRQTV